MAEQASFAIPEPRSASTFILPNSSFNASMDGRPRPLEPDLSGSGFALPAPIHGLIDSLGDLQTPGINRNLQSPETFVRPAPRSAIIDWFSQEKPWDPIQGRTAPLPRTGDFRVGKSDYRLGGPAYSVYRESHVPSECETTGPGALPSDSGYHSRATQSVFNGSTCGDADRSGEHGSISSHLAGLQVDRPSFSESWRPPSIHTTSLPLRTESGSLICPTCENPVKTKSELKKHKQKHEKPHRCDVPGCTRIEGFSTPNDVDRHKRSCHPEQRANGKYFRCIINGCRKKDKKWPRADNFRQHLKRVHKMQYRDDDLEDYVYKETARPGSELAGLGSVGDDLRMDVSHSDNWPVYDLGTTLQAIQGPPPRYSGNLGYPDQQMGQYQDASVTHQQLHLMASEDTEEQMSQAPVQVSSISPTDSADGSGHIQNDSSQSQLQEPQALEDDPDSDSDEQFIESDYLNDESTNESELCHGQVPTSTQVGMPMPGIEEPRHSPKDTVQPAQDDSESIPSESENEDAQEAAAGPENSESLDAVSLAEVATGSVRDQRVFDMAVNTSLAEYPAGIEPSLEGSSLAKNRHQASEFIKALEHQGALADLLEELGYQKPRQSDTRTLTTRPVASIVSDSSQVICDEPNCGKVFPRPCELKKHKKRHEKPYGCTFPQCPKRFGSKNDWKRHENSQHCQFELWKCNEPSRLDPNESCGKACHRREQFRSHVSKDHGITDAAEIDRRLDYCRVGRDFESRFWCGFCKNIVETEGRGLKAGTERFDHIDDHYSGRIHPRMDISEWKSVDPDLPARGLTSLGADRGNLNGSSQPPSPPLPELGRKRGAAAEQTSTRKRPRVAVETLWFCCHCGNPSLSSTTATCFMDHCDSHLRCSNCRVHVVPPEQRVPEHEW